MAVASAGPYLGTNLIHGEECVISQDVSENISRKIHGRSFRNSWAPQTLFRGAVLMQSKKVVEWYI